MNTKKSVEINKSLCIGCGKCVRDCVSEKIKLVDGKAQFMYEKCLECGHCYAICPVEAVSLPGYDAVSEHPFDLSELDSDKLLLGMKSRRTIRQFRDEPVSQEMIDKIIEAGRYCPTGTNSQDYTFTVIQNKLGDFEKEAVRTFRMAQKAATPFSDYIKNVTIDDNFFFKGAPLVIVVSGKGESSSYLASSYMELMAASLGLGVLYSGFFVGVAKLNPKVKNMLKLEKGYSPVSCLVIGHPAVEYKRIPPRKDARVTMM